MKFSLAALLLFTASAVVASPVAQNQETRTFCMYCPNNCTFECPINARCVCPGVLEGSDPLSCPAKLTPKLAKKCYECKKCPGGARILCAKNGEPCECPEMSIPELNQCKILGVKDY